MKKRAVAVCLALALQLSFPAFAAEDTGDTAGTVSFERLAARVQNSSTMVKACNELIAAADACDRQAAYDDLLESINGLADAAWAYQLAGDGGSAFVIQLQQEQMRKRLDPYKPENYLRTYNDLVKPVLELKNQIVYGGEKLYLDIASLELDIERGKEELSKLEKTARETQLLHSLGRVPEFACEKAEAARDASRERLNALTGKGELLKKQLQILLGEAPSGVLTLAPVPEVTREQLSGLQYDADLKAGIENSCDLYLALNAVADAKDDWEDADGGYQKKTAEHSYNAAVYTYEAKMQAFQQSFDAVFRSVPTAESAVSAAREALAAQQKAYNAAAARYEIGMLSRSALQDAESDLAMAGLALQAAKIGLASAYNGYCRARLGLLAVQT